jgi:hypothetical protein
VIAEEVVIEKFNLFYKEGVIHFTPQSPVSITEAGQEFIIQIDDKQTDGPDSTQEPNLTTQ